MVTTRNHVLLTDRRSVCVLARIVVLAACAVTQSAGCGDNRATPGGGVQDLPVFSGFPDQVTFTSSHFNFHAHSSDSRACSDAVVALEAHFAAVQGFLGFSWPDQRRVDYWLFSSGGDFTSYMPCGKDIPICTIKSNVFTYALPDEHELVHAYLAATGLPPSFMVEGIATLLSGDLGSWSTVTDLRARLAGYDWHDFAAWRDATPGNGDIGWYYTLASILVRLLVDRFGIPATMSYYHAAPWSADPGTVDSSFRSAFGMSLQKAIADALAVEYRDGPTLRPYSCSAPFIALEDPAVAVSDRCGETFTDRRFQVGSETAVLVQADFDGRGPSGPRIRSCDGQPSPRGGFEGEGRSRSLSWLDPGSYTMRFEAGSPFTYRVLSGANRWVSLDCSVAARAPIAIDQHRAMVAIPRTGDTYYVAFSFASEQARYFQPSPQDAPIQGIRFCRSCSDSDLSCQPIAAPALGATFIGDYILVIPTDVAPGAFLVIDHYDPTVL